MAHPDCVSLSLFLSLSLVPVPFPLMPPSFFSLRGREDRPNFFCWEEDLLAPHGHIPRHDTHGIRTRARDYFTWTIHDSNHTTLAFSFARTRRRIVFIGLALALGAHGFVAFSGNACNGAVGGDVSCDGTCFPFGGRQSFTVRLAFSGPSAPKH